MLKKLIHAVARHRHPWRDMEFDELAEIYASMSVRSFGFGVVGIFVPVYLYTSGVTLQGIFLMFVLFFGMRIPVSFLAAHVVGRIGPKHTIAVSTVIISVFLAMLISYDSVGWPLFLLATVHTVANGFFFIAYNVDFSKVKDKKHGGKELGWLLIFEQAGQALGPIVGGLLAGIYAPEVTLAVAIVILLGSLIPLFMTNEPIKTHHKVTFSGFNPLRHMRDFVSMGGYNVTHSLLINYWPLLIAVFVFTDDTYEKLGIVIGASMAVSIFSARMFGKFIDNQKGSQLLRYGVLMNFVLFVSASLVSGIGGAIAVSTLGQPVTLAYKMPLAKGLYDAADGAENYRIVYLVWAEIMAALFKFTSCVLILIASMHYSPESVIRASFALIPFAGLLMLTQRFPALSKK